MTYQIGTIENINKVTRAFEFLLAREHLEFKYTTDLPFFVRWSYQLVRLYIQFSVSCKCICM